MLPIEPQNHLIRLHGFARNEEGAVAVIVALLMIVLLGFVALGVDTASLYRDRAQLQSVTDLTVMSATAAPEQASSRARDALGRNNFESTALETLQTGRYLRNPALEVAARFTPLPEGNPQVNAVRVVVERDAALHFSRIFTDDTFITLDRTATATRTGAASFSLTSHLVNLNTAALNEALSQRFGFNASLTANDTDVLAGADVDLRSLLAGIRARDGDTSLNPANILNATTSADTVLLALQSQLPDVAAQRLSTLITASQNSPVDVAAIVRGIDPALGLTATDFLAEINLSALNVVNALVAAEETDGGIALATDLAVSGLLSASTTLHAAEPPVNSGWIALGETGVQLHHAATRLETDINLAPGLLSGLGGDVDVTAINLPVYTEIAGSTATLETINCTGRGPQDLAARFQTAHTPLDPANGTSVAALYLGTLPNGADTSRPIDPGDLEFADLVTLTIRVELPLLPDLVVPGIVIQARSYVAVGQSNTQTVAFTHGDIASGRTSKSFGSSDILTATMNDLLSPQNTEIRIKPGQEDLISGQAAPILSTVIQTLPQQLLTSLTGPVDGVIDQTLNGAGLELGAGELTLNGHHCELVRLVN